MSAETSDVTLQINFTPSDLLHAEHVLPHQLRALADQVAEILFVVDTRQGRGPRFEGWTERLPGLRRLLERYCAEYPYAASIDVDYSAPAAADLAAALFGGHPVPRSDWNGTAVYQYFFGLHAAKHDYVFHLDSDMMFGGGSRTWVAEAVQMMQQRPAVVACNPLPGPPTPDGQLRSQQLVREPGESPTFRSDELSTRLFLIDRARLSAQVGSVRLVQPRRHRVWQARIEGRPPYELAEVMLSRSMAEHGLVRIDFLGRAPGMWSIHPPHRSKLFYESLPRLIERIELGDIPEGQRGDHDINSAMLDWSDAKRSRATRARLHADLVVRNLADLLRPERNSG